MLVAFVVFEYGTPSVVDTLTALCGADDAEVDALADLCEPVSGITTCGNDDAGVALEEEAIALDVLVCAPFDSKQNLESALLSLEATETKNLAKRTTAEIRFHLVANIL